MDGHRDKHWLIFRISALDFPRPPINLNLYEEVPNTVSLTWDHSPDIKEDGSAHYVILKRDTSTATWFTAAEKVYSNKYTVTGLLPGRKYFFRVIAHNDIGDSDPLDSRDSWHINKDKELFHARIKEYHERDWRHAPYFITPLKNHAVRRGHDCTMSCAFLGNPRPVVTLYKGNVNITANSKFWYNSTSGVCTLVIPACTTKDSGDYSILIENELGQEKCNCTLRVYDKDDKSLLDSVTDSLQKSKHIIDSTDQWKVARVILTVSSHYPLSQILRMKDHDQCPDTYQKDSPKSGMRIHIQQIMTDVLKAWMWPTDE
ncbi:UNVERIFIED_CONTAM: hypothetical protein K2H54_064906 [Gekko kuhli]